MSYVSVAETSDVPVGSKKVIAIRGKEILITNVNGNFYAIGNRCPHEGVELSKGPLEGNLIVCPRHKAKFDVTTGKVVHRPKYLFYELKVGDTPSYEVKVEGNSIMLKI